MIPRKPGQRVVIGGLGELLHFDASGAVVPCGEFSVFYLPTGLGFLGCKAVSVHRPSILEAIRKERRTP